MRSPPDLSLFTSLERRRTQSAENGTLSILVRVKNERVPVERLWNCLQIQADSVPCQFIFLDSGSTDGTREFLERCDCSLYSIAPSEFSFGSTCNLLMELSSCQIAVFLSGHVYFQREDSLLQIAEWFRGKRMCAGYMRQVPNPAVGSSGYERAYLKRRFPLIPSEDPIKMGLRNSFSNAASVLTRDAWATTRFKDIHGSEDHFWAAEHLRAGGAIYYLPCLPVEHSHHEPPDLVYKRVRLNVEARQMRTPVLLKAAAYFFAVLIASLREGDGFRTSLRYAKSHARAYL